MHFAECCAGAKIYIKRDDLLPFSFGGNKLRIADELFRSMKSSGCDTIISYGSPSSNMNRVIAQLARAKGIRCHVIIKRDGKSFRESDGAIHEEIVQSRGDSCMMDGTGMACGEIGTCIGTCISSCVGTCIGTCIDSCGSDGMYKAAVHLNERIAIWSGADITYCTSANVKETVEAVMERVRSSGGRPYYIYGDSSGRGNAATLMKAYYDVYGEIRRQAAENGIHFDHIFIAVGTGASISGLVAAREAERGIPDVFKRPKMKPDTTERWSAPQNQIPPRIHGISVARKAGVERKIILDNLKSFNPDFFNPDIACSETLNPDNQSIEMPDSQTRGYRPAGSRTNTTYDYGFDITDEYLYGGYAGICEDIDRQISHMLKECGVPLDPVYTGKAYYGMKQEIIKNGYSGNCLFIHTGGLPLLLDHMAMYRAAVP